MKKMLSMAMGLVLASSMSVSAFADEVKALPSPQKIYINGEQVGIEAFNINGSNYFMLRDLGKYLNFTVEFDKETNSVKIIPAGTEEKKPEVEQKTEEKKPDTEKKAEAEQKTEEKKPEADKKAEAEKPPVTSLKNWVGTWNSMTVYLDDVALDSAYEMKGKQTGKSGDDVKAEKKKVYASDISAMVITENMIKYYEHKLGKEGGEGKLVGEDTYKHMGEVKVGKGMWQKFEATNANPKYKYIVFTAVHGDDMPHFHVRFSNKSMDDILTQESFPTFIKYDTTLELLKEEIAE